MRLSRRTWLGAAGTVGMGALAPGLTGCSGDDEGAAPAPTDDFPVYSWDGTPGPEGLFSLGVASGDPLTDAVVIWTRVAATDGQPVDVWWEIAKKPDFRLRAAVGTVSATDASDFTVKVDVDGLEPGTTYYYRFFAQGRESPIGRTRTAPTGAVDRLRFAVVSCSNFAHGYFHVYRHVAARADLDAVLHLGDYIYEYGSGEYGNARPCEPTHEITTLDDYRARYRQYRSDPDLQEAHRQHPFIVVWDDHETADNSYAGGANNHTPPDPATGDPGEGEWSARKAAGQQAYFEYIPLRDQAERKIFRKLSYGNLCDLIMLDTRLYGRDEPIEGFITPVSETYATERQLLGAEQEAWFFQQLRESNARWKVVGQQIMMAQLKTTGAPLSAGGGSVANADQWDGYPQARERLFELLEAESIDDMVVLTGDIHSSWANDIAFDPNDPALYDPATGDGSLAVEFVTPAVSSPGMGFIANSLKSDNNPHIKYADGELRGCVILDLDHTRAQGAWFHVEDVAEATLSPESFSAAFSTATGENRLREDDSPAAARAAAPALAP